MEDVRLDIALVFEQAIQDIDGLPDAARNEVAEESDVGVGDMVVTDAAIAAIADMVFRDEVLFVKVPTRPVGGGVFAGTPKARERKVVVCIDDGRDGLVQSILGHVSLVNPCNLSSVGSLNRACGLAWTEIASVAESGQEVALSRVLQLGVEP